MILRDATVGQLGGYSIEPHEWQARLSVESAHNNDFPGEPPAHGDGQRAKTEAEKAAAALGSLWGGVKVVGKPKKKACE